MKKIIEIKNLTKSFGKKIANDNISFDIYEGERIAIVGGNGAGKTTLVEQIIGTSIPTSGEIVYNFDYKKSPQEEMGMQFQESSYPEGLTVKDIIEFSLQIYNYKGGQKEIHSLIEKFQVTPFINEKAKSLSGGQQQKLNVLLAITHNPKIVILDEISTGLDISAREEIIGYIDEITKKEKITTILISHNMNEVERLCTRLIVLKDGKLLNIDTIKNIQKKHKSVDLYMKKVIGGKNA